MPCHGRDGHHSKSGYQQRHRTHPTLLASSPKSPPLPTSPLHPEGNYLLPEPTSHSQVITGARQKAPPSPRQQPCARVKSNLPCAWQGGTGFLRRAGDCCSGFSGPRESQGVVKAHREDCLQLTSSLQRTGIRKTPGEGTHQHQAPEANRLDSVYPERKG